MVGADTEVLARWWNGWSRYRSSCNVVARRTLLIQTFNEVSLMNNIPLVLLYEKVEEEREGADEAEREVIV